MANTPQAKKRVRQNDKRHLHNAGLRSMMRTYVKRTRAAIEAKDKKAAEEAYKVTLPAIDKLASKGLIHKNKAARYKSRLQGAIKSLSN